MAIQKTMAEKHDNYQEFLDRIVELSSWHRFGSVEVADDECLAFNPGEGNYAARLEYQVTLQNRAGQQVPNRRFHYSHTRAYDTQIEREEEKVKDPLSILLHDLSSKSCKISSGNDSKFMHTS